MTPRPGQSSRTISAALALGAALLMAACGGSTDVSSSTIGDDPATTTTIAVPESSAPPTTTPATTTPETTAPETTAPETTAPETTAPETTAPETTAPETTAPPTTDPPVDPPVDPPETAFVAADEQLLEVDVATGATVRVLDEFFSGDGVFRGGLRLSPDRSIIWISEGYEDGWYGCDTSVGSFGFVDVETGAIEIVGVGANPEPAADGDLVAYISSSLCLPDPTQPEFWVLTPPDRVVVRKLSTGEEREFVTDTPPDGYDSPSTVLSAVFSPGGSLLVLLGDGRLINVDVDGSGVIQEHPTALPEVLGQPIAATADALITLDFGDEGSTDVFSLDPGSGAPTLLASAGAHMAAGVSADGHVIASSFDPVTIAPGATVAVVELVDDRFVYDIDW